MTALPNPAHTSDSEMRRFVESISDYAIILLDTAGKIVSWNAGAERLQGYRAAEIIGRHFSCFFTPEDLAGGRPERLLENAAAAGRYEEEGWRVRQDGSRFWAHVVISARRDDAGALVGFGGIIRDETARYRAEAELAHTNRFLDSIIESVPAMLFMKDAESLRFVRFNRAGEELLGWQREQLVGKSDYDFFPKEEADFFVAKDREVLSSGRVATILEESIQTANGQRFLHTRKIPIRGDDGKPQYLLGISQDITELRNAQLSLAELNRKLEEQNQELVRASRAKSDFLAMMSHELRTPLNSIIGFSEVLIDETFGPLNEKQAKYLRNVYGSGRHLLNLINDLLDLSKIEAGRLEVSRQPCPVRSVVDEAVATLQPLADGREIRIVTDSVDDAPLPPVSGDTARLKQVLYNLLSNAIKFSPPGAMVAVKSRLLPDGQHIRTTVTDSGPGIASEDLSRLFTPFTQLDNARHRGGTGLGLALTRQLVELMGGTIGVESKVGAGSTFHIDLPVAQHEGEIPVVELPAGSAPLVLVVDDEREARELTAIILQSHGYRVLTASNGEDALALARRARPGAITLDVSLPAMDGWDVLRALRADPVTAEIPVVMVTISSDRQKAFSLGAMEHLIKPVDRDSLLSALQRRSFTTKVKERPIHILAIDDDPRQLELIRAALGPHGFHVQTEVTGRGGLAVAQSSPVDLILLDLVMPDLSGVEVVAELRSNERTRRIPILLVTAYELEKDERLRLSGDIDAVLAKGRLGPEALLDEVERVLRRRP